MADTEIELKLALVKGSLGRARDALGVTLTETRIEDIYFDTPDACLRRRGLVLRLRRDGGRWLQTLKAGGDGQGVIPVRGEWEVALPTGCNPPALDLERFELTPLRVLLRAGLQTDALVPVFRSRIARRRGVLVRRSSEIEVALDRGDLRARVDGHKRRLAVAEVELELKSGRPEDLLEVGAELVARRSGLSLVPSLRTKAERGYALAAGGAPQPARASARGFAERIEPSLSPAQALRHVMQHGVAVVVANADAMRSDAGSEHVHQARVALRRMRSAVRLFDARGEHVPERLREDLHWLGRHLGEARDWDVLHEQTLPTLLASMVLEDGKRHQLIRRVKSERNRASKRAIAAVRSRRYARMVLRLARWSLQDPPPSPVSIGARGPALLEQAADSLFEEAGSFRRLGRRRRHRVRVHAKRLRYALDLLAASLPGRAAHDYIDALAELQDCLGELNDAAGALERLGALEGAAVAERVGAWFGRIEPELVARAAARLQALARRPRPWSLPAPIPPSRMEGESHSERNGGRTGGL